MQSNIKYANILIIALAVAYFIIGGMNLFGLVDGKVILLCSIVSLVVAIVQILDAIASGLQVYEMNVLKISVGILKAWGLENEDKSQEQKVLKISEFKNDQKYIQKEYNKVNKKICMIANILLTVALVVFIFGLSTNVVKENSKMADTLSLFSFALIFGSLVIQTFLEKCISNIEIELNNIFGTEGENK